MKSTEEFWDPFLENDKLKDQLHESERVVLDLISEVNFLDSIIKTGLKDFITSLERTREKYKNKKISDLYDCGYKNGTLDSLELVLSSLTDLHNRIK
jgi:hypothetical protein